MVRAEGGQNAIPEGSQRVIGRDAQRINIAIGYAVASLIRTSLGPKGMDKMLVSELGDVVITNDGATILDEMNVDHPVAKIMVEVAKTQDKEVGDGTTTSVLISGYLLKNAGELLDQSIHSTTIAKGYKLAAIRANEILDEIALPVKVDDDEILKSIANVAIGSKSIGLGDAKDYIAELIVDSVKLVMVERDGGYYIDTEHIKIEKKTGESAAESKLIRGIVIDKEVVHSGMPKKIDDAKIALLECPLEIEKTETDARIEITSPEQMQSFLEQEEKMLKNMVDKIKSVGANVVFCQKGIDDLAQHYLAKNRIMAVRRVKKSDMDKLANATHARVVSSLDDLSSDDLGRAGLIEERKVAGDEMVFVEKCKDAKSVTLFLRASTEQVLDEVERAVVDAIGAVSSAIEDGKYVIGGGCTEVEVAQRLRDYATKIGGREQLAIQAFANALDVIPRTLAESAGMDAIDTLVSLRAKHKDKNNITVGVDVVNSKVDDMKKQGVIEPLRVKKQAISSATEATNMILRIDDIISAKPKSGGMPGGPGGPGGMSPGMM